MHSESLQAATNSCLCSMQQKRVPKTHCNCDEHVLWEPKKANARDFVVSFMDGAMRFRPSNGLKKDAVNDWSNYLRDTCVMEVGDLDTIKIGGPRMKVEVDESMFTRRENNVGRTQGHCHKSGFLERFVARRRRFFWGVCR